MILSGLARLAALMAEGTAPGGLPRQLLALQDLPERGTPDPTGLEQALESLATREQEIATLLKDADRRQERLRGLSPALIAGFERLLGMPLAQALSVNAHRCEQLIAERDTLLSMRAPLTEQLSRVLRLRRAKLAFLETQAASQHNMMQVSRLGILAVECIEEARAELGDLVLQHHPGQDGWPMQDRLDRLDTAVHELQGLGREGMIHALEGILDELTAVSIAVAGPSSDQSHSQKQGDEAPE